MFSGELDTSLLSPAGTLLENAENPICFTNISSAEIASGNLHNCKEIGSGKHVLFFDYSDIIFRLKLAVLCISANRKAVDVYFNFSLKKTNTITTEQQQRQQQNIQ